MLYVLKDPKFEVNVLYVKRAPCKSNALFVGVFSALVVKVVAKAFPCIVCVVHSYFSD